MNLNGVRCLEGLGLYPLWFRYDQIHIRVKTLGKSLINIMTIDMAIEIQLKNDSITHNHKETYKKTIVWECLSISLLTKQTNVVMTPT